MMARDRDDEIVALIRDLTEASKVSARHRPVSIKPDVEKLTTLAYDRGLLPEALNELVDLITVPSHLDQASLAAFCRNLYPVGKISDEVVLKVVGCLGHGQLKPSLTIQGLLLRWLVLVYHNISSQAILSQAYNVLFNLVDTAAIRPQLCHLLALITRRKHVRPFRIQAILNYLRQAGKDPNLLGLLRVYKNYYPEIIVGPIMRGRASPFKHPDPQWRVRLDEIQAARQQNVEERSEGAPQNGFRVNHQLGRRAKGRGAGAIPAVHTSHAQEESVTLEEIESAESLVLNLDKIELPSQLVAVLADPLLQKLLLLRPTDDSFRRVHNWIASIVSEAASGDGADGDLMDLLETIHDYIVNTKNFPPLLLVFFRELVKSWNGHDKKDLVLESVSYVPLGDFDDLHESIFCYVEVKLLDNSPESQLDLLTFYTKVCRRWTGEFSTTTDPEWLRVATSSADKFIKYVDKLALAAAQNSPTTSTYLAILDYYEQAAAMLSVPGMLTRMAIPALPPQLVYLLFFSQSTAVGSRLCTVLTRWKKALEAATGRIVAARALTAEEREHVTLFNGFLMDICNCVWRGRAFATSDTNAAGCDVPRSIVRPLGQYVSGIDKDLTLTSLFTLSFSPSLSLQSITHVRELEDAALEKAAASAKVAEAEGEWGDEGDDSLLQTRHAGPVTHASLSKLASAGGLKLSWHDYRSGVLQHLERQGLVGLPSLLYSTMRDLMAERSG